MRRHVVRGLVAGWIVVAVAGWGVTQWVGEPVATSGPGRVVPPAPGAEPGPQPESDCAEAAKRAQSPTPDPSATVLPSRRAAVGADGQAGPTQVLCDYAVYESH